MNPAMPDPVIDELREIRRRISTMCDHDPAKMVAYFQQVEAQHADRLVTPPRPAVATAEEGADPDRDPTGKLSNS